MESRKQKMRESLARRNFIEKNKEGAKVKRLNLSSIQIHHQRIESARVHSEYYEQESHIYNLCNYIKKHSNRRDKVVHLHLCS
jgi:hypothetical protein